MPKPKPVIINSVESALDIVAAAPPELRARAAEMVTDAYWRANREADEEILAVLQRGGKGLSNER